jgi:hypothetical protein
MPGAWQLWGETLALLRRRAGVIGWAMALALGLSTLLFAAIVVIANTAASPDSSLYGLLFTLVYLVIAVVLAVAIFVIVVVSADADEGRGETLRTLAGRALAPLGKSVVASLLLQMAVFLPLGAAGAVSFLLYATLFAGSADRGTAMLGNAAFFALALLFSLPVLWFLARFAPVPAVYAAEGSDIMTGLRRSWELTRGHGWLMLRFLMGLLPLAVVSLGAQLAVQVAGLSSAMVVASLVVILMASLVFWVLAAAGSGVLYRRLADAKAVLSIA